MVIQITMVLQVILAMVMVPEIRVMSATLGM